MADNHWAVRLSAAAESDIRQIVLWSRDHFGIDQANIYVNTITLAPKKLNAGPTIIGTKERSDIGTIYGHFILPEINAKAGILFYFE
ncbi:type II toxin-antitoxin system RelE/ParE family toxin [Solimicrobium silvestre]|uniref:Plasmid stabilization system protein n=1 Tax=Solimicrobium silvestre TaxID=2099400 RepID=A0A2S9H501_9BURK|nr:type II toxin-antitoxin system RelE/ParE family toxin [Solimicrobium silvestre]PRC95059.1 hypothetical protein S2091_0254 [Solimicrobium silvestre]